MQLTAINQFDSTNVQYNYGNFPLSFVTTEPESLNQVRGADLGAISCMLDQFTSYLWLAMTLFLYSSVLTHTQTHTHNLHPMMQWRCHSGSLASLRCLGAPDGSDRKSTCLSLHGP